MIITPGDIKSLIRASDVMLAIESGNKGNDYNKKLTAYRLYKIRKNKSIGKLLNNIIKFKGYLFRCTKELSSPDKEMIDDLLIYGNSVATISVKYYTGTSSVYRAIDSFGDMLYKKMINDREFEQTVNYLINRLQKYI